MNQATTIPTPATRLGIAGRLWEWLRPFVHGSAMTGSIIILVLAAAAILAPLIAPYDPLAVDLRAKLQSPSLQHWLGTDQAGRDVLSRLIWGARASLKVGMLAVVIGLLGGLTLGLIASFYAGGFREHVIMRSMDAIASIPLLIWAIAVIGILGVQPMSLFGFILENEIKIVILVGLLYVPVLTRVTHSVGVYESKSDYVRARRMQGARDISIIVGDVLPNCLSPVIIQATFLVATGILIEASLSFIGLGVQPPIPSWGTMLTEARLYLLSGHWWLSIFPGLAISLAVIGFNLIGDALRDALDPRYGRTDILG